MLDNYQDLIDELLGTPAIVRKAITAGDEASISIVLQMQARDRIVLERLQRIKNQNDPHLRPIPPSEELIAAEVDRDPDELLSTYETARGDLISILMNLTLRDWERTATTDESGVITLADEVETHVEFDEELRARLQALA